jgi:hypothetical protein
MGGEERKKKEGERRCRDAGEEKKKKNRPQEVAQSAGITPHEAEVTSSNPSTSRVDMSKKNKKQKKNKTKQVNYETLKLTK